MRLWDQALANYISFFKNQYLVVMSVLRKDKVSLLLMVICHSILWMYYNLFNHSPAIKYFEYMYKFVFLMQYQVRCVCVVYCVFVSGYVSIRKSLILIDFSLNLLNFWYA